MGSLNPAVVEIVWLDWIGLEWRKEFPFSKKTDSSLCLLDCFCENWVNNRCVLRSEKKTSLGKQAFYVSAIFVGACLLLSPIRTSKHFLNLIHVFMVYNLWPDTSQSMLKTKCGVAWQFWIPNFLSFSSVT